MTQCVDSKLKIVQIKPKSDRKNSDSKAHKFDVGESARQTKQRMGWIVLRKKAWECEFCS